MENESPRGKPRGIDKEFWTDILFEASIGVLDPSGNKKKRGNRGNI